MEAIDIRELVQWQRFGRLACMHSLEAAWRAEVATRAWPWRNRTLRAYIMRLELLIQSNDGKACVLSAGEGQLDEEISELRSYLIPLREEAIRKRALTLHLDQCSASGFLYSEIEAMKPKAQDGAPASRRFLDLYALDLQSRGKTITQIADQLCDCFRKEHKESDPCYGKFRSGMNRAREALKRLGISLPDSLSKTKSAGQTRRLTART